MMVQFDFIADSLLEASGVLSLRIVNHKVMHTCASFLEVRRRLFCGDSEVFATPTPLEARACEILVVPVNQKRNNISKSHLGIK